MAFATRVRCEQQVIIVALPTREVMGWCSWFVVRRDLSRSRILAAGGRGDKNVGVTELVG